MKFFKPHSFIHSEFKFEVEGITYIVHTLNYHLNQGYARVMIEDTSTKNRYYVHNRIEINNHVFYVSWNEKYSYSRDNYVPGQDLTVYVDEEPEFSPLSVTNCLNCGCMNSNNQNIKLIIS